MSAPSPPGRPSTSPTFAIAFGGGGARGLAHIQIIETLDELGIRPVAISGSSIGSIMGAGMAAGMSGRDIREFAAAILSRRAEVASRLWKSRPHSLAELMSGGIRFGQFNLERILRAFLPPQIPQRFEDLAIPLKVTGSDYYAHELLVMESGDLRSALAASSALPAVFQPVEREGRLLIDGGFYDPVPFDLLMETADIVIGVDVVGFPVPEGRRRPDAIDLLFGANQIMMHAIVDQSLKRHRPQILIRPPVSQYRVLDFLKIEQVLKDTSTVHDELVRAIDDAVADFERRTAG